ncbi:Oxygen-dependent choline dehydrogenase [Thalassocella blandensis]|nr:Oxygen-dependent choline dehydrogenase [Thalassocella blandensis]
MGDNKFNNNKSQPGKAESSSATGDQRDVSNNTLQEHPAELSDSCKNENSTQLGRREFAKRVIRAALASGLAANGLGQAVSASAAGKVNQKAELDDYEYVIVGSGAGGGPLAANLARQGFKVLVLEAGDADPQGDVRDVPAFHPFASEDPKLSWEFFVKHYADQAQQERDSKYVVGEGVMYPRGSTIGGSTAVHALITVYPHDTDFDRIAEITGDTSWNSTAMRQYFQRLERCEYLPKPLFVDNDASHGFSGWLPTRLPDLTQLLEEPKLFKIVKAALLRYGLGDILGDLINGQFSLDINDLDVAAGKDGPFIAPFAANKMSRRHGVREYLLETAQQFPDRLHILTNALASKILFDGTTAIGVQYRHGESLYRADRLHQPGEAGELKEVFASREVIVCGGAFNSPQLLKLSGIGPSAELQAHGIEPLVDLPGVGENLQDRYEVGVVSKMKENFGFTEACTWGEEGDPCLQRYNRVWWSRGPYGSNGATLSLIKKSKPELDNPDLFIFGLPAEFTGYYPGYSQGIADNADRFSWVVLKAHTNNTAGKVLLKSADPQEPPEINFHYFHEGNDSTGDDLAAVVEGVKISRHIMKAPVAADLIEQELVPGNLYETDAEIAEFVKNEAWGHHASCTNKMGHADDPMAVVDSKFRVFGTRNLRVVDASVFPYIPGFFIVVPVYMISEKACDDIVAAANNNE